ncbi:MAG: hypothetical protein M1839_001916 [Geoglossum umbratile]|nr:MAG: hypothetical protein M1839_001916 [Geoglossum umbratile]
MDLLAIISTKEVISAQNAIRGSLKDLPRDEQLSKLIDFFQIATDRDARLAEFISEAWNYLNANNLWAVRYSCLQALKEDIDYDNALKLVLGRHQANQDRRRGQMRTILNHWNQLPETALPSDLHPLELSTSFLSALAALSKICSAEIVVPLLHSAVQARKSTPHAQKHDFLITGDISNIEARAAVDPHGDIGNDGENGKDSVEVDGDETGRAEHPVPTSVTALPKGCTCPVKITEALSFLKDNSDNEAGLRVLKLACHSRLTNMCRRHLRTLSSYPVGLHNNHSDLVLRGRITKVLKHASNLTAFKVEHHDWFGKLRRPPVTSDRLAVYRYPPVTQPEFRFDETKVFERFAGTGAWQAWQRDGTMVIDGVFDYLDREDMGGSIDVEFAIYRHHHRNLSGRSRMGWLRNMFYSLIQQLVRQDPVWYAIIASARPDKNWRLITYPYITKDTDAGGETTGLLHLDLNTSKFVQDGSGGNLLSSSMSLDNEESDGCTMVVPGFHRHAKEWHARRLRRGENPAGFTTNYGASCRAEDKRD